MSCSCGESKCSCSERCFCLSELCLCTVCLTLKNTVAFTSEERNLPLESSLNASTVPIKQEAVNIVNKSNSDEKNGEIVYSSYGNLKSDIVSTESDKTKLGSKKESSSNIIQPEITLSDTEYETVLRQQDISKVGECSFKKVNSLLKIKSNNKAIDLKLGNYKRYFEYFSSKVINSRYKKRNRLWKKCRLQNSKKSKSINSQSRKRPASMSQYDNEQENESNKREVDEELSKFHTFFNDGSSGYSDYDTDENKSTKTSIASNHLSSLNIGGSFSEPEGTGCDLSETEPCSRCKRKKRMLSFYKSLQNNERSMEATRVSKFQEGPSTTFGQENDAMPFNETEIRIKKESVESSILPKSCPNDIRNLSVYDFDEKESEISSSNEILNFRKRSVKIDNSGKLQINVYPNAQPSCSGKSSQIHPTQTTDSNEMGSQATSDNQYVSQLNANSSAETLNDYVLFHKNDRTRKKIAPKIARRRRKKRKTIKCKQEERSIKMETKVKTEIKKEKEFHEKKTNFIKREIKKEMP